MNYNKLMENKRLEDNIKDSTNPKNSCDKEKERKMAYNELLIQVIGNEIAFGLRDSYPPYKRHFSI